MTKIVINTCYGGFGLSVEATLAYAERKGITLYPLVLHEYRTGQFAPYVRGAPVSYSVHYATKPLNPDGTFPDDAYWSLDRQERTDPDLIAIVEEMGAAANGDYAALRVVEIPDDIEYTIEEYDGSEWIAEKHRTWR